ncbi:MAG: glucose-6-phosphate isomerase [Alphaproteobacteria bacterium]|nr:MAG: glucose-6-phosphate isomerase [Alphaproteobacteria bacterium]
MPLSRDSNFRRRSPPNCCHERRLRPVANRCKRNAGSRFSGTVMLNKRDQGGGKRRSMYQQDIENPIPNLPQEVSRVEAGLDAIRDAYAKQTLPVLRLPGARDDLARIRDIAEGIRDQFSDVVILGTGGASLGAQALAALKGPQVSRDETVTRLHFADNLAPQTMETFLRDLDLRRTHFVVISKSGTTPETLAQLVTCFSALRLRVPEHDLKRYFTVIVQPGESPLRRFAEKWELPVHDHDPDLGGRYSVFSIVGVLPAMIAGLDAIALREGAEKVLLQALNAPFSQDVPAVQGAGLIYALKATRNININVLMPYESRLEPFSAWYKQLWAESVAKNGAGTTPLTALGPVDQHSQLQLFLDGPRDKFFTIITTDTSGAGPVIDSTLIDDPELGYLSGHTIGDLVAAEGAATIEALRRHGRPFRHIRVKQVNERTLGALMMHFILETVMAAHLFGVDPFTQPAVELGKRLTRRYLAGNDEVFSVVPEAAPDRTVH